MKAMILENKQTSLAKKEELFYRVVKGDFGSLGLLATDCALKGVAFMDKDNIVGKEYLQSHPILDVAEEQLKAYMSGNLHTFSILLDPEGTEFQKKVWKSMMEIPYGETRTYGEIATLIGSPKGARAVGMAANKNPIPIIIPCHRIIGASGKLVGYAGGLSLKETLLQLELKNKI